MGKGSKATPVQDIVRREQHEMRELVSLTRIAWRKELTLMMREQVGTLHTSPNDFEGETS